MVLRRPERVACVLDERLHCSAPLWSRCGRMVCARVLLLAAEGERDGGEGGERLACVSDERLHLLSPPFIACHGSLLLALRCQRGVAALRCRCQPAVQCAARWCR